MKCGLSYTNKLSLVLGDTPGSPIWQCKFFMEESGAYAPIGLSIDWSWKTGPCIDWPWKACQSTLPVLARRP